jgi:hypothetical protein
MDQIATIAQMVREAEEHADEGSKERLLAIQYYKGKMTDTPADKGRSIMTTRDVRAHIKKVLPSLMRTLLGSAQISEFLPVGPEDEEGAKQATDFMNSVVVPESDAHTTIEHALHDALLLRNGILRWWYEVKVNVSVSMHTGLTDDALAGLVSGDDVEVLEHSASEEMTELGPVTLHDVRIKHRKQIKRYRSASVPRERFLIHPDAADLDDSPIVGERCKMRRSDLVAMGYDKETIYNLPIADDDEDTEQDERRDEVRNTDEPHKPNEEIEYYDLYVRFDMDGDGIAELHHMVFAGGLTAANLLLDEECDEVQYCDITTMSQPHQWEGISLADDLMDLQRGKTVLLRQTLDNIYWQNNAQPIFQDGAIKNKDAVYNPAFGLPIETMPGVDVRAALGFNQVPFVAQQSFGMMEYLDKEATERTGVSDASSGLAPDALQNMTAKASAMIEQSGIGQTELMVRTAAKGLRRFFQGLLRLVIRHQDVPRTVRLRNEWVEFDPRHWNAEMDCVVNTGLGAGTRERDMIVMQQVMGLQEKLLAGFGPDNPFVKPENVFAALSKLVEAAGLKTVDLYFTEPDPEEIAAKLEAMKNQPSPDMMKAQAQQQEAQAKLQLEQQRAQAMLDLDRMKAEGEMQLAREQMAAEFQLKREQMTAEMQLKREQMAMDMVRAPMGDSGGVSQIRMGGAVG